MQYNEIPPAGSNNKQMPITNSQQTFHQFAFITYSYENDDREQVPQINTLAVQEIESTSA